MYTIKVKGPSSVSTIQVSPDATYSELCSLIEGSFPQFQSLEYDILQGFPPEPMNLSPSDPISLKIKGNDNIRIQSKSQAGKIVQATGPVNMVSKKVPREMESVLPRSILSKREVSTSSFSTSASSAISSGGSIASTFFSSFLGSPTEAAPTSAPSRSSAKVGTKSLQLSDAIGGVKVIAFYFSAHWCPPCRQFTPRLASEYHNWKASKLPIEVIFCSSDRSEQDFNQYYAEMPWAALPFNASQISSLKSTYSVNGIPRLVVLNAESGAIIENNAVSLDAAAWCRSVK